MVIFLMMRFLNKLNISLIWMQGYEWFEEILRWLGVCGEKEDVFIFKDVVLQGVWPLWPPWKWNEGRWKNPVGDIGGDKIKIGGVYGWGYEQITEAIGPGYRLAEVGTGPFNSNWYVFGREQSYSTETAAVWLVHIGIGSQSHLFWYLGLDGFLNHSSSKKACGHGIRTLSQDALWRW